MSIRTIQSLHDASGERHATLVEVDNGNGDKYTAWEFSCDLCNAFDTHLTDVEVVERLEQHAHLMYTNVGCPVLVHHVEPNRLFVILPTKNTIVGTVIENPGENVVQVRLDDERQTIVRLYEKVEHCPDLV